ncbi:NAD(P)/FAD-dependent oxidoreductase [Gracilimonas sp.]|uniref:NAD(P)/FAD-dependent oxidoreductase n=1 Tax=Gracilimonas sp. TaxID=1974203 RepID=UPI002871C286|nr:FAD-dependent oxidoreductase [Gracilimonas sp.]
MAAKKIFDFCVFGAGLAGVAVSQKLLDAGATVCLFDIAEVASGASGTPLGMVNPATGRGGTKAWRAKKCLESVTADIEFIQTQTNDSFYKNTGILRPAQDENMAERMKSNALEKDWPQGWCKWLDAKEVAEINPDLHCVKGGMWLPKGLTVNVAKYLQTKVQYLTEKGLTLFENASYLIDQDDNYTVNISGERIVSKNLIFTAGSETDKTQFWDFLPLHPIKGQLAIFETPKAGDFDYSISALGYIASISKTRFIAGSTYEHHYDDLEPDEEGLNYLKKRLGKVYPALFKDAKLVDQWAGVRASTPNRKPFVGQHPEFENIYVFAGLGSKGLLYSDYLGGLLAEYIMEGASLPPMVSVERV